MWTIFSDLKAQQKTGWGDYFANTDANFEPCSHMKVGQFVISAVDSFFPSFNSKISGETSTYDNAGEAWQPQKQLVLARGY